MSDNVPIKPTRTRFSSNPAKVSSLWASSTFTRANLIVLYFFDSLVNIGSMNPVEFLIESGNAR
ncbi:MAG: hypothetical protein HYU00_03360 [Nitrosarchaeum sp.]|nr:hypothetical protein [Nitrosarchaeum sp.]